MPLAAQLFISACTVYEVVVHGQQPDDIWCNCLGTIDGGVCKHVGAVLLRLDAKWEMSD